MDDEIEDPCAREVFYSCNEEFDHESAIEPSPLIPNLPEDLVVTHIWPRLLTRCRSWHFLNYRAVSSKWRDLVYKCQPWRAIQGAFVNGCLHPAWNDDYEALDEFMDYMMVEIQMEDNGELPAFLEQMRVLEEEQRAAGITI